MNGLIHYRTFVAAILAGVGSLGVALGQPKGWKPIGIFAPKEVRFLYSDDLFYFDTSGRCLLIFSDVREIRDSLYIMSEPGWQFYSGTLRVLSAKTYSVQYILIPESVSYANKPFTDTVRSYVIRLHPKRKNAILVNGKEYTKRKKLARSTIKEVNRIKSKYLNPG